MNVVPITILEMTEKDWNAVRSIYIEGIGTKNATFEQSVPDWTKWDSAHLKTCRLVASSGNEVLGWAALSPASSRDVYRGVAEVSIYVASRARGQNIGSKLLTALIQRSEENCIWTLQAGIFPENSASIGLHERQGFRVLGHREKIGCMDGHWRDVCLLERRSTVVGKE